MIPNIKSENCTVARKKCTKNKFLLRISLVNVNKSEGNCGPVIFTKESLLPIYEFQFGFFVNLGSEFWIPNRQKAPKHFLDTSLLERWLFFIYFLFLYFL